MNPVDYANSTKYTNREAFGAFIKARRESLGLTIRDLATQINVTPAYISDIERGNRNAPKNHMEALQIALQIPQEQTADLHDLAGVYTTNWPDINEYLGKNPGARKFIRYARDTNMSGEEVMQAVEQIIAQTPNTPQETEIERI